MAKKDDIRAETVEIAEGAAIEMYLEVLRAAFKGEGLRGVAFASDAFATEYVEVTSVCETLNQTERMTAGTIAAYVCGQWAPSVLAKLLASKN
jgi:hypothetical protein